MTDTEKCFQHQSKTKTNILKSRPNNIARAPNIAKALQEFLQSSSHTHAQSPSPRMAKKTTLRINSIAISRIKYIIYPPTGTLMSSLTSLSLAGLGFAFLFCSFVLRWFFVDVYFSSKLENIKNKFRALRI